MCYFQTSASLSPSRGALRRRSAFTLMELLLVVGVLVAVAAIAIPTVTRTFSSRSLTQAADRVRTAMGQARVKSIRTGSVHAMCYVPGQSWLKVTPLNQLEAVSGSANQRLQQQQNGLTSDFEDDLLPAKCVFVAGATADDTRSAMARQDAGVADSLQSILFYPDGSSQDAQLTIQNSVGQLIGVRLRGLTGTAAVVRRVASQGGR